MVSTEKKELTNLHTFSEGEKGGNPSSERDHHREFGYWHNKNY